MAAGQQLTLAAWGSHHLGQVQRVQARQGAALDTYQQALEITTPPGQPALPASGLPHVGMAEVAYAGWTGRCAGARHGGQRDAASSPTQALAMGLATLAWIRQAKGDQAGALDVIGEAERIAPSSVVTSLLNPVPAQRARLLLAQGEVTAAAAGWTNAASARMTSRATRGSRGIWCWPGCSPRTAPPRRSRCWAAAHGRGRPDRAGSIIEIQALQALALGRRRRQRRSEHPGPGVMLGCPQGYVRVFADEGAPMSSLLRRLVAAQKADHAAPAGCRLAA